jgi:predicted phosphodiesterase
VPSIEVENAVLRVNPGHLKDGDKRGFPPTYAVLEVEEARITARILEAGSGATVKEVSFKRVTG